MKHGICLLMFFSAALLGADPRVFVPVFLKTGAINEIYVWDESPIAPFQVEVRRRGSESLLMKIEGFAVDRPLSVLGASNRPLKWGTALLVPDALADPGMVELSFIRNGKPFAAASSEIHPRVFPVEEIPLDQAMTDLRSKPDARKDREAAEIWKIFQKFDSKFVWTGGHFHLPLDARTSAQFGDVRLYRYSDETTSKDYHRGVDFAVPQGTAVYAPAAGTVVMVADRLLTGNTVVVEHAPAVYSVYFHLSKVLVKKGSRVDSGDRLALSGATGLVTGPHLHWEIRVAGVPADPLDLVIDGLLDIDGVNTVISSIERPIH